MAGAYSGALVRTAHYAQRPPPPGLAQNHFTGAVENPDIFDPDVDTPDKQTGTIWGSPPDIARQSNQPNLAQVPVNHWYDGQLPVPTNVPYEVAQQAMQDRMMVDHEDANYVPDSIRLYQHASEGMIAEWNVGRMPQNAGEDTSDDLHYLVAGTNSYDYTNQPNEVYTGDDANVGRYRLGRDEKVWGLYDYPIGKFGQDAIVHAYTGLTPALPSGKPPMTDTNPYTPNSTGTAHWEPAQSNQVPSNFALPSETVMTDYATVATPGYSDFIDDERL